MKRWPLRITICLILGVVTTVGVAWGCAVWAPVPIFIISFGTRTHSTNCEWSVRMNRTAGGLRVVSHASNSSWNSFQSPHKKEVPSWSVATTDPSIAECEEGVLVTEDAYGWPSPTMRYRVRESGPSPSAQVEWGLSIGQDQWGPIHILPLRPITGSFLGSVVTFAAVWFGLLFAPGMARRFIRTRRGRCPRCGYDLRGEFKDGCSECGWGRGN